MKRFKLILVSLLLFFLSCNKQVENCDRKEFRVINKVTVTYVTGSSNPELHHIRAFANYKSYFVKKHSIFDVTKNLAFNNNLSCFEGITNEITKFSVTSNTDFNDSLRAGNEINELFVELESNQNLSTYKYEEGNYENYAPPANFPIISNKLPVYDSIHTLYFKTQLADGMVFYDTLKNVNMNTVYSEYYSL